jgi:hypothetical protein
MTYPLLAVALCILCAFALPFWVYDVNRWLDEPGSFAFWRAVVGMVASVVILEGGLWLVRKIWEKEVRILAPGEPLPERNPVTVLRGACVVYSQLTALMMFFMTLDGGVRWSIARWVYLAYAVGALVHVTLRWQRWTFLERLCLCWAWAPVLAFGVPIGVSLALGGN